MRDLRPKSMLHTENPSRYWAIVRAAVEHAGGGPLPIALVVMSESVSGGGLFLDIKPWTVIGAGAGVLALSALLWLPLALGIKRSISQMTRVTAQIAEGRFEARVNERRGDELGELGGAINQMAERLSGLVAGQKRFLGDVAHELCSPLAKLRVALGILDQRANDEQRGYVNNAEEEAARMAALVNELLAFSKAAVGAQTAQLRRVSVATVVQEAVRREASEGAKVIVEVDAALEAAGDAELLTRAVGNLLRNALRYAGAAGPITISASREGGNVVIAVRDCGPGVPEDELAKLFDPFYRLDPSRDRAPGGVGLGLAIVKTCVAACGGTVTCRNRTPSGLEARIELKGPEACKEH